jgi:hypothetical protein
VRSKPALGVLVWVQQLRVRVRLGRYYSNKRGGEKMGVEKLGASIALKFRLATRQSLAQFIYRGGRVAEGDARLGQYICPCLTHLISESH